MGMFLVCFLLIYKLFSNYRLVYFIGLGVAMGILINLRIMGVMLFTIVVAYLISDIVSHKSNKTVRRKIITGFGFYFLTTIAVLYISWSYLYPDPLNNFVNAFQNMSKFRWNGEVLYLGEVIKATELPWHYAAVWFSISTPIWFLILGLSGIIFLSYRIFRHPGKIFNNSHDRHLTIYLVSFIAPFVIVVLFNSVIYVVNHPHQQVYFNWIANRSEFNHERTNFEMDYWGTSYRKGLEAVLKKDKSDKIKVMVLHPPGEFNLLILPPTERVRIQLTHDNPKYFITNYRYHPEDFNYSPEQEIFSIQVQNNTILSVFQLRE